MGCRRNVRSVSPFRSICVRFFNSVTTKNFFAMVSAEFEAKKETYTFEEVLKIVCESLRSQINKEHLEDIFFLIMYLTKRY